MKTHRTLFKIMILALANSAMAQDFNPSVLPVRGLCIAAPAPEDVDRFDQFIREELAPRGVNTLILRVDFNYQYERRPELSNPEGLSKSAITQLVSTCQELNIDLVPQVNLLGHQSWASTLGKLLTVYPQFDETPHVEIPEAYEWPNEDGLYCKSYCPLHPDVHDVVFDVVNEICEVFQSTAFHAGMDEVFYIADEQCPRCSGRDPAELFAGEVTRIRNHLAKTGRTLWIWGDRLIDGKTTGMGMWEASMNNTYRAIDMIPRDVLICDWHYERPDQTPVYFAVKGLNVVTSPWRNPSVGEIQVADMVRFRQSAKDPLNRRYQGIIQTVWSGNKSFMDRFDDPGEKEKELSDVECFKRVFAKIQELHMATASPSTN